MKIRAALTDYVDVAFRHPPWAYVPCADADGRPGRVYAGWLTLYNDEPSWTRVDAAVLCWTWWLMMLMVAATPFMLLAALISLILGLPGW